jgi:hypothetical protein
MDTIPISTFIRRYSHPQTLKLLDPTESKRDEFEDVGVVWLDVNVNTEKKLKPTFGPLKSGPF